MLDNVTQRLNVSLRRMAQRIDARFPWLARWLGGRLDIQLPAYGVSLLTHLVLLTLFAMIGYAAGSAQSAREFQTELVDTSLEDFAEFDTTALAEIDQTTIQPSPARSRRMSRRRSLRPPSRLRRSPRRG